MVNQECHRARAGNMTLIQADRISERTRRSASGILKDADDLASIITRRFVQRAKLAEVS